MKRLFQIIIAIILLGSITVDAEPFKTWIWMDPTVYENQQTIPVGDLTNRTLYCGMQQGGPYVAIMTFTSQISPSNEDMAFVVAGVPGTYYCVATTDSIVYQSTAGYSNEVPFVVAPGSLGFVPEPMILGLQ